MINQFKSDIQKFIWDISITRDNDFFPTIKGFYPSMFGFVDSYINKYKDVVTPMDQIEISQEFLIFYKMLSLVQLDAIIEQLPHKQIAKLALKDLWTEIFSDLVHTIEAYQVKNKDIR